MRTRPRQGASTVERETAIYKASCEAVESALETESSDELAATVKEALGTEQLVVVLDELEDLGNRAAILRTVEALGFLGGCAQAAELVSLVNLHVHGCLFGRNAQLGQQRL